MTPQTNPSNGISETCNHTIKLQMVSDIESIMKEYGFEFPYDEISKIWNKVVDIKDQIEEKWEKQNAN